MTLKPFPGENWPTRVTRSTLAVGALALTLVVAACAPAAAPAQPTAAPAKSGAAPAQTKPSGEPIKIGALMSTTGILAPFGNDALPGAQILAEEINAAGGINGRPIELIHVDDESKPEQTVSAAKRLIQQDQVVAVIGPVSSVVSASASAVWNENKVPAVGCICYEGKITEYEFSVFPLLGMMQNQAEFAKKHGVTKLGVISQAGALAELIKATHVPVLEQAGLSVVGFEQFQPTDTDLTPLLARLRSNGAEQVYVAASGTPAATVAKNFKQINYPGHYWTFVGNANEAFINLVGDAADVVNAAGLKILVYEDLSASDPVNARVIDFAKKYKARTGREPGTYAAVGYDALLSTVEAIKQAGTEPAKIRDALETQTGLQLLNGRVERQAEEHNGLKPDWLTVKIDPAKKGFSLAEGSSGSSGSTY